MKNSLVNLQNVFLVGSYLMVREWNFDYVIPKEAAFDEKSELLAFDILFKFQSPLL